MSGQQPGHDDASRIFQPLAGDDPTTVAGYRLAARLGAGGMGKVYLSYTPGGRAVAIKVIRSEFGDDPEFRRRFAQEVKSAQRVQGLFTAPVIDADTDGQRPWLATAYVPGPSLADAVVTHGALPVETVLLLVAGMAEALHVIHGAGIVHRDLKPSNVLLAADGPRVIDFGIAYAADATSLTGSGVTIGTPTFMAPEQAEGGRITPATDIFALGQVAAYAATGVPAFGEGTSHGVLYRIVHQEPDLGAVPERLRELVARTLAKDPAARPSIAEIISLCQAANAETVLRRPEDWLPTTVAADITVRTAAPAPAADRTPPPPAYTPTAPASPPPTGYTPTAHASPAPSYVPTAHATPPPTGYAPTAPATPAPATPAPGVPGPVPAPAPAPAPAPGYAYPPAHTGPHPTPFPNAPVPPGPRPPAASRKRGPIVALAAALVFGIAAGGTAYMLLKEKDQATKSSGSTQGGSSSAGGQGGTTTDAGAKPSSKPSTTPEPKPADFKGINLTAGYHLTLGDENVRPQDGEDGGYELSYDTGGYLDAESSGGSLVLLDAGQEGSLAACLADTRFTENVDLKMLSPGRQVCVTTGTGHMGLVTVRGFSAEDSPSKYLTLDLTVWRNAVRTSG